jgi:hypothetical protein
MAYPFPGYGAIVFTREEMAVRDSGWSRRPSYAQSRPLGTATDNLVLMAIGSATRTVELHLSPSRFTALEALVGVPGLFVDWDRPAPVGQSALLLSLEQGEWVAVACSDGSTQRRIRSTLNLVSQ